MLCPEGTNLTNEDVPKEENNIISPIKNNKIVTEGSPSLELHAYKRPKNWRKSISNFFRNQLRSTKSNDGDGPSCGSQENFEDREISPEQKWQSLGKVFRRQSFGEHWNKTNNHDGESSSHNKRQAIRKVLSSYFAKPSKSMSITTDTK